MRLLPSLPRRSRGLSGAARRGLAWGISRRDLLLVGPVIVSGALGRARSARGAPVDGFALFREQGRRRADLFVAASEIANDQAQQAYLDSLAELLAPVKVFPSEAYVDHPWGTGGSIRAAKEEEWPLRLYFVRMRAGAAMPPHDHVGHVGLLRILSGEVRVRTFREVEGSRTPAGVELELRDDAILRPGETTRVHRDLGVHEIAAIRDASFLDVMTVTVGRGEPVGSRRLRCPSEGPHCAATWIDS